MGFLANTPKIRNSTAGIIVFLCSYTASVITAFVFFGAPLLVAWTIVIICCTVLLCATGMFILARLLNRVDIADIGWSLQFLVIAAVSWVLSQQQIELGWNIQTIAVLLTLLWALRLISSLITRMRLRPDDWRYSQMQKKWRGGKAINVYVRVFIAQGLLAVVVATPIIVILLSSTQRPDLYTWIGVSIWAIGFFFEAAGDWQLQRFSVVPKYKKKLLTTGLRRYSRHPSYFGETMMWLGIFIIGLSTYVGWVGIISPVVIAFLLLFVSGIPLTEAALAKRTGWKKYKQQTSRFIPLPPKI